MQQVIARPPGVAPFPFFIHDGKDKFISSRILRKGVWEPFESRILLGLLRAGDQIIDVGANIGWYTVSAAHRVGVRGHVFAFEPDERNYELLSANVRQGDFSWVTSEKAALGRASGAATIHHSSDNQGDHRVRNFAQRQVVSTSTESVRVIALDQYLADNRDFDLERLRVLKVDVQGFEAEVLRGARKLLSHLPTQTVLFIEFDPVLLNESGTGECDEIIEMVGSLRRKIFAIARPIWRLVNLDIDKLKNATARGSYRSFDLVIAHPESLRQLRQSLPAVSRLLSCDAP
jgi:FkbM family methyltransferase